MTYSNEIIFHIKYHSTVFPANHPEHCPPLESIEHGTVLYNGGWLIDYVDLGTHASYHCDKYYNLIGNEERICQILEKTNAIVWSGSTPYCRMSCKFITVIL